MSEKIIIPSLGESITEATITRLFKKKGDTVKIDETLLELETEKITIELPAKTGGIITEFKKKEGDNVKIGEVIGIIEEKEHNINLSQNVDLEKIDSIVLEKENNKILSPAVNRLIKENNINPNIISGTGKRGMITKEDVLNIISKKNDLNLNDITVSSDNHCSPIDTIKPIERVRISKLRQTIARRLKESQNNAAILTTFNEINMGKVVSLRQNYKEIFEKKYNIKLGFMSFFVKATVSALKAVPIINSELDNEEIVYKNYYDIGVAVSSPKGLVVPVIRDCDKLTFAQIEMSIATYIEKIKNDKVTMEDLNNASFTISNGGVFGSLLSTPIINPPQSGILGLHKIEERPIVIDGKIVISPMMYIALSYDHRIVDGKDAVTFLVKIKENIENPERLLLNV